MKAEEYEGLVKAGAAPLVLDVRSGFEFNSGHISGAVHAPLSKLLNKASSAVQSKEDLLLLICEHGPRAQVASMLPKLNGYKNVDLLDGHMSYWRSSGKPVRKVWPGHGAGRSRLFAMSLWSSS